MNDEQPIRLGAFELLEVIGRGGMGDVWRARHITQGLQVAVKVVTSSRARKESALSAFRNEVHAMARLDHPGIVMVFELERVSATAAEASAGILTEGAPALAMELASHGTLERVLGGLHWRRLRAVLFGILDALAHAHARGVIHRDLKPGNVLVTADEGGLPRLKLADFGLAQAMHRRGGGSTERKVSGTLRYMAPEQIEGRWRDQGPWTDLYALGCVVYWLLHGRPPFNGKSDEILAGHLFESTPPLVPPFEVPAGFPEWVARLLEKNPRNRHRRAADAARALFELDPDTQIMLDELGHGLGEITENHWTEPHFSVLELTAVVDQSGATRDGDQSSRPLDGFSATVVDSAPMRAPPPEPTRVYRAQVPVPDDWRARHERVRSLRLLGAGLGLYGLRPVPLVGRERERETMWQALREVHERGSARVLCLEGTAGTGKSRLAEWLCDRAHEVGAAQILRAFHGREASAASGIPWMLAENLRCLGLDHDETRERIKSAYFAQGAVGGSDVYDCLALAEMISPAGVDDGAERVRFSSPTERHIVVVRYLQRLAEERPLVVWLDDVQWGHDALEMLSFLLATGIEVPALFVLTVRSDLLIDDTPAAELMSSVRANPRATSVTVGPLPQADHGRLVEELLSLEPTLAHEVASRTSGNPLFAVQLVGDWVQRGILEVSSRGFALRKGSKAPLPDSIHQVWSENLEQLFAGFGPQEHAARVSLEVAASLGQEVVTAEWTAACATVGTSPPADYLQILAARGLVVPREGTFAFEHGLLRESMLRQCRESGRSADVHRACATMLAARHPPHPEILERIGRHLVSGEHYFDALEPLYQAAFLFGERSDFSRAKELIAVRTQAMNHLELSDASEHWGESWHVMARCLLRQGLVDEAAEFIQRGSERAERHSWHRMLPEFTLHMASLARKRGNAERAERAYMDALEAFRGVDEAGAAKALYGIGEMKLFRGELRPAIDQLQAALSHAFELEHSSVIHVGLASARIRLDEFDEARKHLEKAVELTRRSGNRSGRAAALNMLGELERARGELALAEAAYHEALDVLQSIGSRGVTIPRLNLALVYLARNRWSRAREELERGLEELREIGEVSHVGFVHLALACAAAGLGDWGTYDDTLAAATQIFAANDWVDRDIAEHADLAARLAHADGQAERAREAQNLANAQWAKLGDSKP